MKNIIGEILLKVLKIFLYFVGILITVLGAIFEPLALVSANKIKNPSELIIYYVLSIALAATIIILISNFINREELFSFEDIKEDIEDYKDLKRIKSRNKLRETEKIDNFRKS